jgi:hypothetical protein
MSTGETPKSKASQASYIFREAEVKAAIETIDKATGRVKYGQDDLMPQWLYSLYYDSPIHGGIVNQKVQFIKGDGLEVVGPMAPRSEELLENGSAKHTLDEVVDEVALDLEVLAYFYLLFKKQVDGRWIVEPISGELMRPNEHLTQFFYSDNWKEKQSPEKTGYKTYKSIFYVDLEEDTECVMYVKLPSKQTLLENGKLTSSIFPRPPYAGAIPSILADIEMNFFHYAEVVNGWTSNTILNMNDGLPESEIEKKRTLKEIHDQTTDRKKKGGMTVFFNDGVERAATILNVGGNNNDTRYLLTQEHGIQTIMIGHSVQNTALFGLEVAGKLGGVSEIPEAFKRFMGTYVKGKRDIIAEALTFGLSTLNKWEGLELEFKQWQPDWLGLEIAGDGSVADAINGMSPLVANALLQVLTVNEKRGLANLPPVPNGDAIVSAAAPAAFNADEQEDPVLEALAKVGRSAKDLKVVSSKAFDMKSTDEAFISEYLSEGFATDLTEDQTRMLQMIAKGESYKAIVDAIGKGAKYVSRQLIDLTRKGLVDNWELTREGNQATATAETITVLYTYERRTDVTGPDILPDGRTRPFCEALIDANKAYTRQEIDQISNAIGRDVWLYRGGWYSNPSTGKNQPSCRHYWKQNIVIS